MAEIKFKGKSINTTGALPKMGFKLPDFALVRQDLSEATLAAFGNKKKVLNIFPSLDTGVCALSVKQFYKQIPNSSKVIVINISKDLPFAQKRFCDAEGLVDVESLSAFRSSFAKDFGLEIAEGPLKGLCSRAVIVLDENNQVIYTEQVPEITQEPDYAAVLKVL
jgi:thioredoxin-dependent peroxiredoxin